MRVALFCVAKDEDRYISEWVRYYLKLGFDNIFIACDRWTPAVEFGAQNVHFAPLDTIPPPVQVPAYHKFLEEFKDDFDFVAFFDIDEFLVLKKHANIHEFLADKTCSVGINWHLFGDSGLTDDGSMGVLQRFIMRGIEMDHHIKSIVKTGPGVEIWHPHYPNAEWIGSDGLLHTGPFCENGRDDVAQLNHYFTKTPQEWIVKRDRGRPDCEETRPEWHYAKHNLNEAEDLTARNFLYGESEPI